MTTTPTPEPIRKSSLPSTPPPEFVFSTVLGARPDGQPGCMLLPGDMGPVVVRRRVTYGDWEPVRPDRWAPEPPSDARAAASPVSVVSGQTLRDHVAEAREQLRAMALGLATGTGPLVEPRGFDAALDAYRDAVLAVLPPDGHTTNRAEAAQWAADFAEDVAERLRSHHEFERANGALDVMTELRRLAAEAPQPEPNAGVRAELKPWQLLGDQPDEPLPQTEQLHGGRRLGPAAGVPAAGAGQDETQEGGRIVAYRLGASGLCCIGCTPSPRGDIWEPVTSADLPDGGLCSKCDVDVLIEQEDGRG
ncbi:hypothetical protein M2164_005891 [Streptomyces sp. SAI-208]|uniref:hypothetical protein n=1 Tax=Streptomyces sp. SAI-208 TaxID=2940550 RepID=UPI0024767B63|nr:hypothetical protein [Streptomyces sp. SAI-208]MDH6610256.1 hypothetical protein [Streptomyces sp. SAI-208]